MFIGVGFNFKTNGNIRFSDQIIYFKPKKKIINVWLADPAKTISLSLFVFDSLDKKIKRIYCFRHNCCPFGNESRTDVTAPWGLFSNRVRGPSG